MQVYGEDKIFRNFIDETCSSMNKIQQFHKDNRQTETQKDQQSIRQRVKQTGRQTDRQTNKQTHTHTDRQTFIKKDWTFNYKTMIVIGAVADTGVVITFWPEPSLDRQTDRQTDTHMDMELSDIQRRCSSLRSGRMTQAIHSSEWLKTKSHNKHFHSPNKHRENVFNDLDI